jgi:hypothetical protein
MESTDSMKITKAQQKIRRFSAFEAEGTQIYTIVDLFCKNGQTVLELDFRAVKFLFFPRRDLNPHN